MFANENCYKNDVPCVDENKKNETCSEDIFSNTQEETTVDEDVNSDNLNILSFEHLQELITYVSILNTNIGSHVKYG